MRIKACLLGILLLGGGLTAADAGQLAPGLKAEWAFGPGPKLAAEARFVAQAKRVWLLASKKVLVSSDGQALRLLFDAHDMVQEPSGKLWMCDAQAAGSLDFSPDGRFAALETQLLLPSPAWRLALAGEHGPVAYGSDPEDGRGKAIRLRDRRVLFDLPVRILAMEATPSGLALATPEGVAILGADGRLKATKLPLAARSLAYVDGAGLVAATDDGAWLLREGAKPLPFLSAPGLRLRAVGGALYALIPAEGGILRLRGLEELKP